MEKIIYVVWRDPRVHPEEFAGTLRTSLADRLLSLGARGLQVNVCDQAVAPAGALRQTNSQPQIDGVLSLWVDSAIDQFRRQYDDVVSSATGRMACCLVTESQPIRNTRFPASAGERTAGFAQLAFLTIPPRLTAAAWLDIWHNHHTQVAIDTQDNFLYVQNVVVRWLTHGAPHYDAIVEECFPDAAMTDPHAFFDAVGDPDKFQRNLAAMMDSCNRFIDFGRIDVVPTSQYIVKTAAAWNAHRN
ncbi:MAG: EthD domain-containing protein [Pseudomonadota bacterium]